MRASRRFGFGVNSLLILSALVFSSAARADYAWIPVHKKMIVRTGADWNKSYENFDGDGYVADFSVSGKMAEIREFSAFAFAEYGIAERWSAWGKLHFVDVAASAQTTGDLLAAGSGIGDTWFGFKHAIADKYPLVTAETFFKFPSGASTIGAASGTTPSELVVGDGNLDWGFRFHLGLKDGPVLFALSPSFWLRFGNYDNLIMLEAAVQYNYQQAYGRLYAEGYMPVSSSVLSTTSAAQTAAGTAGSFMKLAYSPTAFLMGVRGGFNFTRALGAEAFVAMTFQGSRVARNLKFGLNMIFNFDFYEADYRPKMREVPFSEYENANKFD